MAWYSGNYGEPIYVRNADSCYLRDGLFYQDPAPVSFRTPPFHNDDVVCYRRSFRDQYPHFSHGGEFFIPAREQVHIRKEDPYLSPYSHPYPYPTTSTAPWWLDGRDHRHYPVYPGGVRVAERRHCCTGHDEADRLEFYAPQLCSDSRLKKVVKALKAFPGVANVMADQWAMRVVVVGIGLCEERVLRRLQQVPNMERSVFWRDRP